MKKNFFIVLFLAIAGIIVIVGAGLIAQQDKKQVTGIQMTSPLSSSPFELKMDMRMLWEDHITWTRNVVFCIIDGLPGTDQAVTRLQKNQDDIGEAIKPYYGADAGKKLADLLHVHITTAADVLRATKADNNMAFDISNKKWLVNADEISEFLSKANPNWKLEDLKMMMHEHLKLTTDEVVARKKKDYDADVKAYEKIHEEILKMSDMLADGIIKQFPNKFKNNESIGIGRK